jgi:hypothetical protein
MKEAKSTWDDPCDDLRSEYKRSDFKKLGRGKYFKRVKATSNVVVPDPELARTPKKTAKG